MRIALPEIVRVVAVIDHFVDRDQVEMIGQDQLRDAIVLDCAAPRPGFDEWLEMSADRDEGVALPDPDDVFRHRLPRVRVGRLRHHRIDFGAITGDVADDVGQQRRADRDHRPVGLGRCPDGTPGDEETEQECRDERDPRALGACVVKSHWIVESLS